MRYVAMVLFLGACYESSGADQHSHAEATQLSRGLDANWNEFIKVETVQAILRPQTLSATGRVAFDEDQTQHVGSPVNGRVAALRARLGDRVRIGQALVDLSSPEVAQLQSEVKKSQQDLTLAERAFDRTKRLKTDGAVSDKDVALAAAEYHKARAEVERGAAQLAVLGLRSTDPVFRAALYARVDGTVVERNVLVGQEVRADGGAPLVTVTNLDKLWVLADVYEPDVGQLQVGSPAKVEVVAYPGEVFAGTVTYIGDVVDAQTRTVKVRCVVANPQHRLKPEMFAKVELQRSGDANAIFIPTRALVNDGSKTRVLMVGTNRDVRAREVRVGPEVGGQQRVLEGLSPGDTIVTDGAIFLQNEILN